MIGDARAVREVQKQTSVLAPLSSSLPARGTLPYALDKLKAFFGVVRSPIAYACDTSIEKEVVDFPA